MQETGSPFFTIRETQHSLQTLLQLVGRGWLMDYLASVSLIDSHSRLADGLKSSGCIGMLKGALGQNALKTEDQLWRKRVTGLPPKVLERTIVVEDHPLASVHWRTAGPNHFLSDHS